MANLAVTAVTSGAIPDRIVLAGAWKKAAWQLSIVLRSRLQWLPTRPWTALPEATSFSTPSWVAVRRFIAAERVGRRCYALEVEPVYADTAIRRWQTLTGDIARHGRTGRTFGEMEREGEPQNVR
jgi:hypothetical protein